MEHAPYQVTLALVFCWSMSVLVWGLTIQQQDFDGELWIEFIQVQTILGGITSGLILLLFLYIRFCS